jgi:hypothetical protein
MPVVTVIVAKGEGSRRRYFGRRAREERRGEAIDDRERRQKRALEQREERTEESDRTEKRGEKRESYLCCAVEHLAAVGER